MDGKHFSNIARPTGNFGKVIFRPFFGTEGSNFFQFDNFRGFNTPEGDLSPHKSLVRDPTRGEDSLGEAFSPEICASRAYKFARESRLERILGQVEGHSARAYINFYRRGHGGAIPSDPTVR